MENYFSSKEFSDSIIENITIMQNMQREAYKQGYKRGYEAGKCLHDDNCIKIKEIEKEISDDVKMAIENGEPY